MAKKPGNANKPWTPAGERQLRELARGNTPTPLIAYKLERSVPSVRAKASALNVSLRPTNQSPYNRRPT
ncbi:MAG: hypothetical protein L6Q71_01385 [Planctomycetes bacterium]|nr:hypothetical protein [Planctomycetota bacterium]